MPSTRSKAQAQPSLPFPRRRSSRPAFSKCTIPLENEPPAPSPEKCQVLPKSLLSSRLCPITPVSPTSRIPLSPRKRTGDDNVRTLPAGMLGSPPKQSRQPPRVSPRKLFDENSENSPLQPMTSPRKMTSPKPMASPKGQAALPTSPAHSDRKSAVACLFGERSRYQAVKQALHTAVPERLLSRDTERSAIRSFLEQRAVGGAPASLYISGAPGTGKTACFHRVLADMKEVLSGVQTVAVNCMTLRSAHGIFPLLAQRLGGAAGGSSATELQRLLTSAGPPVLLVLDEMDQLDSKSQEVLYTIFEWPYLAGSRLCLVGIANALDLTDRILPRLQALPRCRPLLLHFPPYTRLELAAIVQDRLTQASSEGVLDASAVQFCARKVSAVSGDARKTLDICRRAVEIVEADHRRKSADHTADSKASRVSVPQVARVLSEVYGDRMACPAAGGGGEGESFPLQQKLLVCTLLLLTKSGKHKEVPLGKLHEVYSRLCSKRQVGGLAQGECLSLCSLLESRGIFSLRKAKEARLTKVFLKIEERDVENALRDRTLLGSILEAGLP